MGAFMDQVEAYFVFTSKAQMEQAFSVFNEDAEHKTYREMFNFINLNDTYLFVNDPNNYPYTMITMMDGYFSELIQQAYWGQYFLRSEEMEIDESYTKPLVRGLQLVEPHQEYTNIPGFTDYFTPVPGWKKFTGTGASFTIEVVIKEIEGQTYFYYEDRGESIYFPWVLSDRILLHIEGNKIYGITHASAIGAGEVPEHFNGGSYMKEIFANTWEGFHGCSYILSEESGFRLNRFMGVEKNVVLQGQELGECLVLKHDYIHVNCYQHDPANTYPFEHYICKDVVYYTYWQKEKGLMGIVYIKENTRQEFICSDITAEESMGEQQKTQLSSPANEVKATEEKKGLWGRLFSKK